MNKQMRTITMLEEEKIFDYLVNMRGTQKQFCRVLRDLCMVLLMLDAGLRVWEMAHLLWSDCFWDNLPAKSIIIRKEIAKNKKGREIPASVRLMNALETFRSYYADVAGGATTGFVFTQRKSEKAITCRQIERITKGYGMAALGKPINPHMLRHTFGTKLMRRTNARTVQALLGHSSLQSTQIYMHPNNDDLQSAIDTLN